MDLCCRAEAAFFSAAVLFAVLSAGCSEAVKLVRDTGQGGIVTYAYKEERGGHLGSRYRREAQDLIKAKCGSGYRTIREGEAQGYASAGMGIIEGTEDEVRGRRWAIQFECKAAAGENKKQSEDQTTGLSK